jgi:tRNA pseudouridine38-40 synthase
VQPGRRTVAGTLAAELVRVFGAADGLTVAGRTDAGVHATGQVCHVDLPARTWADRGGTALRRLAGLLPPDLRVLAATVAPEGFDARFSALSRCYEYRVTDAPYGADPLRARYLLAWPRPLDLPSLVAASAGLVGEHDFAAYCRRKENATTIRTVEEVSWRREPDLGGGTTRGRDGVLVATVRADAFCQNMVRSLVGGLLAVGDGRRPVAWPAALLSRAVRADEVVVAPPHGLTLVRVGYPLADELGARAELTRNRRSLP